MNELLKGLIIGLVFGWVSMFGFLILAAKSETPNEKWDRTHKA